MAVQTLYFDAVNGDLHANGADGTSGNPYSDIQDGLDNNTVGADINEFILQGEFTITSPISLATYGGPSTNTDPFIWSQWAGQTQATINGGGTNSIMSDPTATGRYQIWSGLRFRNWDTVAFDLDNENYWELCEFDAEGSDLRAIQADNNNRVVGCKFLDFNHTTTGSIVGAAGWTTSWVMDSYFEQNGSSDVIETRGYSVVSGNFLKIRHNSANGIVFQGSTGKVAGNTVDGNGAGATGYGIGGSNGDRSEVYGNVVSNFAGTGAAAIKFTGTTEGAQPRVVRNNRWYNCTSGLSIAWAHTPVNWADNSVLPGDPYTNRAGGDFSPSSSMSAALVDPEELGATNPTNRLSGAFQRTDAGGGGGSFVFPGSGRFGVRES